jgi:Amt family ammonium transporter
VTWVIAGVGTFILLKILDAVVGLRCTESDEQEGLDITQHGERGYNLEESYSST